MSTAETLLASKMQLFARLSEEPDQHEREHIERRLADVDHALDALELEPRQRGTAWHASDHSEAP